MRYPVADVLFGMLLGTQIKSLWDSAAYWVKP